MRLPRRIRNTGAVTLGLAVVFALGSGWFEWEARRAPDPTLAQHAAGMGGKLFTMAVVFTAVGAFELHRAQTRKRLAELDRQIAALKAYAADA